MKRKELSSYFNDWYHVQLLCDLKDADDKLTRINEWCTENFSYKGGRWDSERYAIPANKAKGSNGKMNRFTNDTYYFIFRFKNEEDASLFILMWNAEYFTK